MTWVHAYGLMCLGIGLAGGWLLRQRAATDSLREAAQRVLQRYAEQDGPEPSLMWWAKMDDAVKALGALLR